MKSTFIECPECAGHGGEGVYCEECLSTGHIVVSGPAAEVIDRLRADLAAAMQRAEAAEAALADVPVGAIRLVLDAAELPFGYINERNAVNAWLEQQPEVQA